MVITSDCIVQWIVLKEENSAVNLLSSEATEQLKLRRQYPLGISCSCFHKELSILVLAGPTNEGESFHGNTFFHVNNLYIASFSHNS